MRIDDGEINTFVYIDDTKSQSQVPNSKYLSESRRTWAALIMTADEKVEAEEQMTGCLEYMRSEFGVNEFHFTDIYGGVGAFKKYHDDPILRLKIFDVFVEIYNAYQWRFAVQTVDDRTFLEHRVMFEKAKIPGFDLGKNEDLALLLLLTKLKFFFQSQTYYGMPCRVVIDEGKRKADSVQVVKSFNSFLANDELVYHSSKDDVLLQLADFIAFSINRINVCATKDKLNNFDKDFIDIMSNWNANCDDMKSASIKFGNPASYDAFIRQDKDSKEIISDEQFEQVRESAIDLRNFAGGSKCQN